MKSVGGQHGRAFFIETSGSATLNFRQACAVESLAMHNPNLTVNVLFMGGNINTSLVTLKKLKEKYDNIHLISTSLDDYMTGTALEYWYHCNGWRDGPFHVSHLSDGLRFLTLHKYGGYYFDLDVISVRPVTDFRNFIAAESDDYLGSGVIHADFKHPIMELAVKDFATNYR
jgi:lactosylceramide 4-alpha-galactosyltransferase